MTMVVARRLKSLEDSGQGPPETSFSVCDKDFDMVIAIFACGPIHVSIILRYLLS